MSRRLFSQYTLYHFFLLFVSLLFLPISPAMAGPVLSISSYTNTPGSVPPITWNVIGLDSNSPTDSGPDKFPVGARVCNTGDAAATNVTATFAWTTTPTYVAIRSGTNSAYTLTSSLAAGSCTDAYFEVIVTRNTSAYNTTGRYTITASASNASSVTTPTPRDLYIEHLISQSRNSVVDMQYGRVKSLTGTVTVTNGSATVTGSGTSFTTELAAGSAIYVGSGSYTVSSIASNTSLTLAYNYTGTSGSGLTAQYANIASVASGGSLSLINGETYYIKLVASTATNGYEQSEAFVSFPNTIFQILDTKTTYTADTTTNYDSPNDKLYGDGCTWINDPNDPNYRACQGTGKSGGNITVLYHVQIISVPATPLVNPEPLQTLVYDFSGSSYHYNADFSASVRYAYVVDPTNVQFSKNFNPNPIAVNGISTLTFTITNPNGVPFSDLNFSDPLPSGVTVASTPSASSSDCGTPTFSPTGGASSLSASNITVGANGACTLKVNVTSAIAGSYPNTTNLLYMGSTSTGKTASDTLTVNTSVSPSPPSTCTTPVQLARWDFNSGNTNVTAYASDVSAPSNPTYYSANGGTSGVGVATAANPANTTNAWWGTGPDGTGAGWSETAGTSANYVEFTVDTHNYGGVYVTFSGDPDVSGDWANPNSNVYVKTSANGGTYTIYTTSNTPTYPTIPKDKWQFGNTVLAASTGTSTTAFRFSFDKAGSSKAGAKFYLDDVQFWGCRKPDVPTVTKNFSPDPVALGSTSTLTLTVTNPNSTTSTLTGVAIDDYLPFDTLSGTVTVSNGSTSVTGSGTAFKSQLLAGSSYVTFPYTLTGTSISVTNGSATVTGVGTSFATQLAVGSILSISSINYTVSAIASNNSLTLSRTYRGTTNGTLAISNVSTYKNYLVSSIGSDTSLTLGSNYTGTSGSGVTMYSGLTLTGSPTTTCGSPAVGATDYQAISLSGNALTGTLAVTSGSTAVTGTGTLFSSQLGSGSVLLLPSLLSGTVSTTAGSPTVTGTGTLFLTELTVGQAITIGGVGYTVQGITSNTALQLTSNASSTLATQDVTVYKRYFSLAGTIAVTNGSTTVTGTGTAFTTELFVGQPIVINSIEYLVSAIASATSLTLSSSYTGITATGLSAKSYKRYLVSSVGSNTGLTLATSYLSKSALSGASVTAGLAGNSATCTITGTVKASLAGTRTNVSDMITTSTSGDNTGTTGYATDTLTAVLPPTISKLFSSNPIVLGNTATLTFTITNPNQGTAISGISFNDVFPTSPAAMTVANPLTTTNTCGGTLLDSSGGTLAAGDAGIQLSSSGSLSGGSTCTVSVKVTVGAAGSYVNNSSGVGSCSSTISHTVNAVAVCNTDTTIGKGVANDTLVVQSTHPGITLSKKVGKTSDTGPWASSLTVPTSTGIWYYFTVENTGDVALNSTSLSDPTLSALVSTCAWKDGDGTSLSSPFTLVVPNGSNNGHIAYCTVSTTSSGTAGSHSNTATVSGTPASGTCSPNPCTSSSTAYYNNPQITLTKSVTPGTYSQAGNTLGYSFAVNNNGAASLVAPVSIADKKTLQGTVTTSGSAVTGTGTLFTDQLTAGDSVVISTGTYTVSTITSNTAMTLTSSPSPAVGSPVSIYKLITDTVTCPSFSTVGDGDNYLDVGETITCSSNYTVIWDDTKRRSVTNVATATVDSTTSNTSTATATYNFPTYSLVSSFDAYSENGHPVVLWHTQQEHGTLGFFLERQDAKTKEWVRVNGQMLPALIVNAVGGDYQYTDTMVTSKPGDVSTYRLVERDIWGSDHTYGPWTMALNTVPPTVVHPADEKAGAWKVMGVEGYTARTWTREKTDKTPPTLGSLPEGVVDVTPDTEFAPSVSESNSVNAVRLSTAKEGLYQLNATNLSQIATTLGLPSSNIVQRAKTGTLKLTNEGNTIPYLYNTSDSSLYFVGTTYQTRDANQNSYRATLEQGKAMPSVNTRAPYPVPPVGVFRDTQRFEENTKENLAPAVQKDAEEDYWFWTYLFPPYTNSTTVTVKIPDPAASGQGKVRLFLQGGTNPMLGDDREVTVSMNGTPLSGKVRWDGAVPAVLETSFDQSTLGGAVDGMATLTLEVRAQLLGRADFDLSYVNKVEVEYNRTMRAQNGSLWMRNLPKGTYTVGGFKTRSVRVIESAGTSDAKWRRDVTVSGNATTGWQASFIANQTADYVITDSPLSLSSIEGDEKSSLKDRSHNANYLIIAPRSFVEGAKALSVHRKTGFKPETVWLEDIYDEFNSGRASAKAIEDFLDYAATRWNSVPRYVVLMGRGTFDPTDILGYHESVLPLRLASTPWGLVGSDNHYADVDNDFLPDYLLGRISVSTDKEAVDYVKKLADYESATLGPWSSYVALVADNPDLGGDFHKNSEAIASGFEHYPYNYTIEKLYHPITDVRDGLLKGWTKGYGYVNYIGHGSSVELGSEKFLTVRDVSTLANGQRLPIFAAMSCSIANSAIPGTLSLSDTLVGYAGGGAIVAFSPVGLSLDIEASYLNQHFVDSLLGSHATVGEASMYAHESAAIQNAISPFMHDIYQISGDPAVKLH